VHAKAADVVWALIGVALLAVAAAALVSWRLRRRGAGDSRRHAQRMAAQAASQLAVVIDSVPVMGDPSSMTLWWQVVDEEQTNLATALSTAVELSRDDPSVGALREVRAAADAARQAVAADRALRLSRETPTRDQLAYSLAILRESSARLKHRAATLAHRSTAT
jgi:hypothetical protein